MNYAKEEENEEDDLPLNHLAGIAALACAGVIGLSVMVATWMFGNPLKPIPDSSPQHQATMGIKSR
jgi:hypothetical protein